MPPKKQTCHCTKRPTTDQENDVDYDDDYDNDDDDDDNDVDYDDSHDDDEDELAELQTKEDRRQARRRAAKARYRARHPDKVAAERQRYRQKHREKYLESQRRYYYAHREERLAYNRERNRSEHRRAWMVHYRVKKREAAALARKRERLRMVKKIKALGPLKLTIVLEDCLKPVNTPVETYLHTFCQSLEADDRPQPSFCELLDDSYTLTDLDSGEHRPPGSTCMGPMA